MSTHDDRMSVLGVPARFAYQGTAATYTLAGVAVELTAILSPEQTEEVPTERGVKEITTRRAEITRDPDDADYGGVADPSVSATLTVSGVVWAVEGIETQTPASSVLRLRRSGRVEVSQTEYSRT